MFARSAMHSVNPGNGSNCTEASPATSIPICSCTRIFQPCTCCSSSGECAKDRESAEQRAALRAFTLSLRTIAISHMSMGVFSFGARTDLKACCSMYPDFPSRVSDLNNVVGKGPTTPLANS